MHLLNIVWALLAAQAYADSSLDRRQTCKGSDVAKVRRGFSRPVGFCKWFLSSPRERSPVDQLSLAGTDKVCNCLAPGTRINPSPARVTSPRSDKSCSALYKTLKQHVGAPVHFCNFWLAVPSSSVARRTTPLKAIPHPLDIYKACRCQASTTTSKKGHQTTTKTTKRKTTSSSPVPSPTAASRFLLFGKNNAGLPTYFLEDITKDSVLPQAQYAGPLSDATQYFLDLDADHPNLTEYFITSAVQHALILGCRVASTPNVFILTDQNAQCFSSNGTYQGVDLHGTIQADGTVRAYDDNNNTIYWAFTPDPSVSGRFEVYLTTDASIFAGGLFWAKPGSITSTGSPSSPTTSTTSSVTSSATSDTSTSQATTSASTTTSFVSPSTFYLYASPTDATQGTGPHYLSEVASGSPSTGVVAGTLDKFPNPGDFYLDSDGYLIGSLTNSYISVLLASSSDASGPMVNADSYANQVADDSVRLQIKCSLHADGTASCAATNPTNLDSLPYQVPGALISGTSAYSLTFMDTLPGSGPVLSMHWEVSPKNPQAGSGSVSPSLIPLGPGTPTPFTVAYTVGSTNYITSGDSSVTAEAISGNIASETNSTSWAANNGNPALIVFSGVQSSPYWAVLEDTLTMKIATIVTTGGTQSATSKFRPVRCSLYSDKTMGCRAVGAGGRIFDISAVDYIDTGTTLQDVYLANVPAAIGGSKVVLTYNKV